MQDIVTNEAIKYRVDFLKYRYFWMVVSIAFLAIGVAAYVAKGGFRYHIDFSGGAELRIAFDQSIEIGKVRDAMSAKGFKDAVIQSVGNTGKDFLIRVGSLSADTEEKIKDALGAAVAGNKMRIESKQWVGSEVGKDTTQNAIIAIALSLVILLLYIAVRFEFRFGIGAVASLVHDLLAVLVFLLLTGEPISLHVLASILAILGYSLHDCIVIFSRMRENFKKLKGASEYDIANVSINQTLRRTLLTSFATLLSVAGILVFGGEALYGLAVVLFVGIIVGTYSSIYIASPVMLAIKTKKTN